MAAALRRVEEETKRLALTAVFRRLRTKCTNINKSITCMEIDHKWVLMQKYADAARGLFG